MTTLLVAIIVIFGQTVFSQCSIICNGSVIVSLDINGMATITPAILMQSAPTGCNGTFTLEVVDADGNMIGDMVDGNEIGLTLTATLTASDGNACSSDVTVIDDMNPVLNCPEVFIYCNVNANPAVIGFPGISDNVTPFNDLNISYSDDFTDLACGTMAGDSTVTAQIDRTWSVIDASGNSATCIQTIWLLRAILDQVEFPSNFDGFENATLECGEDDPYDLGFTGYPTINNYPLTGASDCELVTAFTDQEYPECGGQIKIVRTWFVNDICTDETRVSSQIINLNDTQAPNLTCPQNVSFNTYANSCVAQVYLPAATASDDCSNLTVVPEWDFGTGHGPYNTVPAGEYDVIYKAEDDCANKSTCTITVTVADDDLPTAICENEIEVVLQPDGTVLVYAETFDDGSHDNCGIDYYLVKRGSDPFDEFVYFDCSDLGNPTSITLQVFDISGLSKQCTSDVIVSDDVDPEIICPGEINVDCGFEYTAVEYTGIAFATDNCGLTNLTWNDNINLNTCGIGFVTRTFSATDNSNNAITCPQTITISDNTPLGVTFPQDILTYECGFDTDTTNTGVPILTGQDCEQLGISSTDFTFFTAYPACYKIVRNWAVIDWCIFQPNDPDGAGIWEHTQIIEVLDATAPDLTCPPSITVGIDNVFDCQTYVDLDLATAMDCSEAISFTNNSPFSNNNGADASGTYPMGTHTIKFTAHDGCGNMDECTMNFTVIDTEAPSPVCNNGISVTVQANGMVTITPNLIEGGSSDNCSVYEDLIFQVSPNTFNCENIGNQTATLTVTDVYGNSSFCQTTIVVQDNLDYCNGTNNNISLAGFVGLENGDPLSQKVVGVSGGVSIAMHTDVDGTYHFENLPSGSNYTITPTYDTNPKNGVTTLDLVYIRKHILNINPLSSPYRMIAADINNSGSVTTLDLVQLRKLILNIDTDFNNNTSWRFVPLDYEFINPQNPLNENFPENITLQNVNSNNLENDFIGIKIGDVNGTANGDNLLAADDRTMTDELQLMTNDHRLEAGYDYEIPITAVNFEQIMGYQFALEFDTDRLEITAIVPGKLQEMKAANFGKTQLSEGILTTSWESIFDQQLTAIDELFIIHVRAKANTTLSEVLRISPSYVSAEAYAGSFADPTNNVDFYDVTLGFKKTTDTRFELYQNQPNPTNGNTTINFYLSKVAETELRIFDLFGKELFHQKGEYTEGQHRIEIDLTTITDKAGILIYELSAEGFRPKRRKLIYVK
ncbi:MAG: hypothetical protein ACJAYJ_001849 [Saprospiraceae bacterium]|jgi:hypothetical protein